MVSSLVFESLAGILDEPVESDAVRRSVSAPTPSTCTWLGLEGSLALPGARLDGGNRIVRVRAAG